MPNRLPVLARAFVVAVAAWLVALALARVGVVDDLLLALERKSLDYRMARYRGARFEGGAAPSDVVIVAIDEASLDELGRFPLWPRAYHARLVDRLSKAGARVVAFDVLFAEPDTLPSAVAQVRAGEMARLPGADQATALRLLERWGSDSVFAASMKAYGAVVLARGPSMDTEPISVLTSAAAGVGHVAMAPDPDGILRSVSVHPTSADSLLPLAVVAAGIAEGSGTISLPEGPRISLDFVGPRGTFLTLSYADVLAGRVEPILLKDRIVFVGATAAGLGDDFATPYSEDFPGVEAHATLAQQLLDGRRIRPAAGGGALTFLLLLLASLAVSRGRVAVSAALAAGTAGAWVVGSFESFAQAGLILPFAQPLFAWTLTVILGAGWRYAAEERQKRAIQHAFGRYLAPDVVAQIAQRPDQVRVGGESRVVTVGFVDIRGFTTLAGRLDPEALARFLQAFFSVVEEEIHARQGTVDKYIGDAVMMVFGAPNHLEDAPVKACEAALAMVEAVASRSDEWRALGAEELRVGVGLETGPAVVGNFGSERRFDYTALGDTVNVASRLQDLNKQLQTTILVGPGLRQAVGDRMTFRERGDHALRGRDSALPVFELISPPHAGERA